MGGLGFAEELETREPVIEGGAAASSGIDCNGGWALGTGFTWAS